MQVFCWGEEKLIEIQNCFDCRKNGECRQYQKMLLRHPDRIQTLQNKWKKTAPTIQIIIRRKEMPKKPAKKKGPAPKPVKKDQKYIFFFNKKDQEVFKVGTEADILKLYQSGGTVNRIFKLGDEMEIVVKLEKKKS